MNNFLTLQDLDKANLKKTFLRYGFIIIKKFFDKERILNYLNKFDQTLNIENNKNESKVMCDTLNYDEFYLDLILDKNMIKINKSILGEDYKFLQHLDLHANQNAHQWHRDLSSKNGGVLEQYNENFLGTKCALYLEVSDSIFSIVSDSAKSNLKNVLFGKDIYDINNYDKFFNLENDTKINSDNILFFKPEPGDLVYFDARILHAACNVDNNGYPSNNLDQKNKKVIWPTFGANNFYTDCLYQYFRFIRKDFGTMKYNSKIEGILNSKKLIPNSYENISKDHIDWCQKNVMYGAEHDLCIYDDESSPAVINNRLQFIERFSKDSKNDLLKKRQEKIIGNCV